MAEPAGRRPDVPPGQLYPRVRPVVGRLRKQPYDELGWLALLPEKPKEHKGVHEASRPEAADTEAPVDRSAQRGRAVPITPWGVTRLRQPVDQGRKRLSPEIDHDEDEAHPDPCRQTSLLDEGEAVVVTHRRR